MADIVGSCELGYRARVAACEGLDLCLFGLLCKGYWNAFCSNTVIREIKLLSQFRW